MLVSVLNAQQVCDLRSVLLKNSEVELLPSVRDTIDLRENYYNEVKLTGLSSPLLIPTRSSQISLLTYELESNKGKTNKIVYQNKERCFSP